MEDIELKPGQTAIIRISKNLVYEVKHTGWVVEVSSTQPVAVVPDAPNRVSVVCHGVCDDLEGE